MADRGSDSRIPLATSPKGLWLHFREAFNLSKRWANYPGLVLRCEYVSIAGHQTRGSQYPFSSTNDGKPDLKSAAQNVGIIPTTKHGYLVDGFLVLAEDQSQVRTRYEFDSGLSNQR